MRINLNEVRRIIEEALLNAYSVLGIPPGASDDEIKKAWRSLAIKNHPDRGGSHGAMVDINNAKDRLTDKTALFRYGPQFKSYEDASSAGNTAAAPNRPPAANEPNQQQPKLHKCNFCGRTVASKNSTGGIFGDRLVNHYTQAGGTVKCEGSGKRTGAQPAGGTPPGSDGPPAGGYSSNDDHGSRSGIRRYFVFSQGRSSKYWEVEMIHKTLYIRYGRMGTKGREVVKTFPTVYQAERYFRRMLWQKKDKGYVEATPPPGPRPSEAGPKAASDPGPRPEPSGKPKASKDAYKVYGWRQGRRVVRVGGKLYGTEPGGNLKDGGNTKFNANDRARVAADGGRMKVSKTDSDHTQTWDPVDEVRAAVDDIIIEMLSRIASSPE